MSSAVHQLINRSSETLTFPICYPATEILLLPGKSIILRNDQLSPRAQFLVLQGKLHFSEEIYPKSIVVGDYSRRKKLTFGVKGPLGINSAALVLCIKDDFALEHIIKRLKAEGVVDVWVFTATHYFNGKKTPQEDIDQVKLVTERAGGVHVIVDAEGLRGNACQVETTVRNRCRIAMKAFEWLWIVDADELWFPGAILAFMDVLFRDPHIKQLSTGLMPFAGVPAYPIDGNSDACLVGMRQDQPFVNIRTQASDCVILPGTFVFHFTGTRRTVGDLVHKNKSSGHFGDTAYDFAGWEKNVLPKLRPGYKGEKGGVHMYKDGSTWRGISSLTPSQLCKIPREICQYLGDGNLKPTWVPKKISLLAPSRWRPTQCVDNLVKWANTCLKTNLEIIVSVDADDETKEAYRQELVTKAPAIQLYRNDSRQVTWEVIEGPNKSMNEALNRAAAHSTGDILISVMDDFSTVVGWDIAVIGKLTDQEGKALFVYDNCHDITKRLQTMGIMTRKMYTDWGYFWYGGYLGMWADNDYTERAILEDRQVVALDLTFFHNHYMYGETKNAFDKTYEHGNQSWKYDLGKKLFAQRKLTNFR